MNAFAQALLAVSLILFFLATLNSLAIGLILLWSHRRREIAGMDDGSDSGECRDCGRDLVTCRCGGNDA